MMREQIDPVNDDQNDNGNPNGVFLATRPIDGPQERQPGRQNDRGVEIENADGAERHESQWVPSPGLDKIEVGRAQAPRRHRWTG